MSMQFKNPPTTASTVGPQITNEFYQKKALIEAQKEQYFTQLADVTSMPKNMGKKIKRYHYLPLLDDANINDQGIDAAGATISNGNLYGSSKDIGTISGKMPALSETGGRVNRVGFKRKEIEGTLEKFGFFDEYTQESMDFDSDAELMMHINREMIMGANEITEDALQIDLLNAAGVIKYAGNATSNLTVGGDDIVTYSDLMRLSIDLDNNRTPKHTKVITGSRMVDTATIPSARVAYIGSELLPTFKAMKDLHNNPAFIGVEKYAAGGTVLRGEVGAVDQFRLVVVPEMMKWAGAGADASADATCYETANKYDVFPILVVGDESFTTVGFQTDGKSVKFKITHKAPGEATADRTDPYGETGFMSIKWYYGFMALRPERLALIKTAAKL
jgi:N4-gp56 family major capsid protein